MQDSMTIKSTMTLTAGTLDTKPNSNFFIKVAGDWINNGGVFIVNNSTVSFTSTASGGRVRSRGSPFRNVFIGSNTTGGGSPPSGLLAVGARTNTPRQNP